MESNTTDVNPSNFNYYEYALKLLVNQKKGTYEIEQALLAKGADAATASAIVEEIEVNIEAAEIKRAKKDILWGSVWLAGGLIITGLSYYNSGGGGGYVVTYGAIIIGAIQLIRGLTKL